MTFHKIDWTRAAQAGLWYIVGLFTIVGIVYIGLSYGLALMGETNDQILDAGLLHTSQQRINTLNLIQDYWYVIPIVVGVLAFIWLIKYGLESDESGDAY